MQVGNDREFYLKIHGVTAEEIVIEHHNDIMRGKEYKRTKGKGEIAKHYKSEYERMMGLRAEGVTGRIDFAEWA